MNEDEGGMRINVSKLTCTLEKRGVREESVRPVLLLSLYSSVTLRHLGPPAAAALRSYVDLIPKNILKSAQLDSGDAGELTARRVKRDLRHLETPPKDEEILALLYSSAKLGPPGDYGIDFIIEDLADPDFEGVSNLLRFTFPVTTVSAPNVALDIAIKLTELVPYSVGVFGYGLSYWREDRFAVDQVLQLLPRYLGFDHSSVRPREWILDRTPSPNWLTVLNKPLWERLGGEAQLKKQAPNAIVYVLERGVIIRSAEFPQVGDTNRHAPDIGELPGVARFLKPKRAPIPFLNGSAVELDTAGWLARFDELDNRPYDNA